MKKASSKWAIVRSEAPKMPWEGDPTAHFFPRMAQQFGTSFALRQWELMEHYAGILQAYPDDDEAEPYVAEFIDHVLDVHGKAGLAEFAAVCKAGRIVFGGIERQLTNRLAVKKQLARVRRR